MSESSSSTPDPTVNRPAKRVDPMVSGIIDGPIKDQECGVPEVIPFLIKWKSTAQRLRIFQILLGLSATFFSILTTTVSGVKGLEDFTRDFAFIAAVSIGILTAFDLGTKSNNMTNAWRILADAAIRFNQGLWEKYDVIDAWKEGEETIGDVSYQQPGGPIKQSGKTIGGGPTNPSGK